MKRVLVTIGLVVAAGCSEPAPDTISIAPPSSAEQSTTTTTTSELLDPSYADATTPQVALEQLAHALGTDDFAEIERLVAGPLTQLAEVERIDARARRSDEPVPTVRATASDLVVTSEDGDRAVATGRIVRVTGEGDTMRSRTLSGPFMLRRASGVWRVVGARSDGAAVVGGARSIELEQRGIVVRLRGVVDAGASTYAVFHARDTIGGRRQVIGFVGGSLLRDGATTSTERGEFVADRAGFDGYASFARGDGPPTRVAITLNDGPQPLEFVFNL